MVRPHPGDLEGQVERLRESAAAVVTADQYRAWARDCLRPVLPHASLLSGWGHFHAGGVALDYLVTLDFPVEHIEAIRNSAGAIDTPILRRWLETHRPVWFDERQPWPDTPAQWLESFRHYGLHNVLAHAWIDGARCVGSYHSFFGLAAAPAERYAELVSALVPVLHEVLGRVIDALGGRNRFARCLESLGAREREVVHWVGKGKTNSEIACIAHLSLNTVKHHLVNVFDKLGVSNRAQLVRRLAEHEAEAARAHRTQLL